MSLEENYKQRSRFLQLNILHNQILNHLSVDIGGQVESIFNYLILKNLIV